MLRFSKHRLWAAAVLAVGSVGAAEARAAQLPEGAGKATMQKICGGCHAPEIVMGRHETREGWEQIVSNMVDKGANGTDAEFDTIIQYLAANFSKNSGDKKER